MTYLHLRLLSRFRVVRGKAKSVSELHPTIATRPGSSSEIKITIGRKYF